MQIHTILYIKKSIDRTSQNPTQTRRTCQPTCDIKKEKPTRRQQSSAYKFQSELPGELLNSYFHVPFYRHVAWIRCASVWMGWPAL